MIRLIPLALTFLWGFNWPAVRIALDVFPPFGLRMIGLGAGAAALAMIALVGRRSFRLTRVDMPALMLGGLLSIAAFNIASSFGQLNTTTSRAAILTFTMPAWTVLFAHVALGEPIDRSKIVALTLGAIGLACLGAPLAAGEATLLGVVFPLIAAITWAAGSVIQKARPPIGDRFVLAAGQLMIGALAAGAGFLAFGEALPGVSQIGPRVWAALFFHVVGPMATAYVLWFLLLDRFPAGVAALTILGVLVVGVLSAMVLIGDRPSALDWLGFAFTLAAAASVQASGLLRRERA